MVMRLAHCLSLMPSSSLASPRRWMAGVLVAHLALSAGLPLASSWAEDPTGGKTLNGGVIITDPGVAPKGPLGPMVELDPGQVLDMKIATVIETGLSTQGDEFFGKLNHDYTVNGKMVLPRGTLVHGLVEQITEAKRAGRDGYINLKLDYLVTPDGREIPIEAGTTTRDNKTVSALKVVGRTAAFTAVGGAVGAIMALRYGGLVLAAGTNGYALAGAAAVGGTVGLATALATKGASAHIPEGAEVKVKLGAPLKLPTIDTKDLPHDEQVALDGLAIAVTGVRLDKDPFGESKELTLTLDLTNQTTHAFSLFDMALVDEYGVAHYASPFGDTGLWFQRLGPNARLRGNLSFSVDDPTLQHYLVFYEQYSRKTLAKIAISPPPPKELSPSIKGHRRTNKT
jgi:hypothetical protein